MADADELRKAEFREIARRIVAEDRERRKYRINGDPTGQIARALERAYRRGRKEERDGVPAVSLPTGHMEWKTIPPKPRSAFWSICLSALGENPDVVHSEEWALEFEDRGNRLDRWVLSRNGESDDPKFPREWGDRTIRPLLTRNLLVWTADGRLALTDYGRATWWAAVKSCNDSPIELVGTTPPSEWAL